MRHICERNATGIPAFAAALILGGLVLVPAAAAQSGSQVVVPAVMPKSVETIQDATRKAAAAHAKAQALKKAGKKARQKDCAEKQVNCGTEKARGK